MTTPWISPHLQCGLGNRLFQFAAALGAAESLGRHIVFYTPIFKDIHHGAIASLFRMYPWVPLIEDEQPCILIPEPPNTIYDYIEPPPLPSDCNAVLGGFRQSPLYFPKDLNKLAPDWEAALGGPVVRRMLERELGLGDLAQRQRAYAVHVRLGDYKYLEHHQIPLSHYYTRALSKIPAGSRLILFSDEPHLCAAMFAPFCSEKGIEYTTATNHTDVESLYQMSLCLGGTITANSTFSWWAAWFAHYNGAAWATYPDTWGNGMPPLTSLFPEWGTVLAVREGGLRAEN